MKVCSKRTGQWKINLKVNVSTLGATDETDRTKASGGDNDTVKTEMVL